MASSPRSIRPASGSGRSRSAMTTKTRSARSVPGRTGSISRVGRPAPSSSRSHPGGSTLGALPEGSSVGESDGFLVKFLPNGTEVWTRQFGTTDYDAVYGMASDPKGVVAVGTTHGAFEGQTNAGDRDVFLVRIAFS